MNWSNFFGAELGWNKNKRIKKMEDIVAFLRKYLIQKLVAMTAVNDTG